MVDDSTPPVYPRFVGLRAEGRKRFKKENAFGSKLVKQVNNQNNVSDIMLVPYF